MLPGSRPMLPGNRTLAPCYPRHRLAFTHGAAGPATDALNGPGVCGNGAPLGGHQDRCGYGQRLPFLLISPYARTDYVSGSLADQTSILAFIEDNWLGGERTGTSSFGNLAGFAE